MKKLLLVFFVLALTLSLQAQWVSYRNQVGIWNTYTKVWDYQSIYEAKIPISFEKTRIVFENQSNSVYRIVEDLGREDKYNDEGIKVESYAWMAIDNKGKRCRVSMNFIENPEYDPLIVHIMYDDVIIRYYCKRTGMDKFLK